MPEGPPGGPQRAFYTRKLFDLERKIEEVRGKPNITTLDEMYLELDACKNNIEVLGHDEKTVLKRVQGKYEKLRKGKKWLPF